MGLTDRTLDPSQYGIFADSEALATTQEMKTAQAGEALAKTRTCEGCGESKECQMEWFEIYCLISNVYPQELRRYLNSSDWLERLSTDWKYHPKHKVFYPEFRCGCQNNPLVLFDITPAEAERVYVQASRNGVISENQRRIIAAIAPIVKQIAAGAQGPQQQQQMSPQQQQAMMHQQAIMRQQQQGRMR